VIPRWCRNLPEHPDEIHNVGRTRLAFCGRIAPPEQISMEI